MHQCFQNMYMLPFQNIYLKANAYDIDVELYVSLYSKSYNVFKTSHNVAFLNLEKSKYNTKNHSKSLNSLQQHRKLNR